MRARCHLDSTIWGPDGMSDVQVAHYYEALDYCKKNVKNFSKTSICEQDADVVMHMHRIVNRPPAPEYIELVKGIDSLIQMEQEQAALKRNR